MSSASRKEKRQKQQIKEAAGARARVKALEAERIADRAALSRAMDDLVGLQNEHNELLASWSAEKARNKTLEAKSLTLGRDNEQLMSANYALRSQLRDFIEDTRNLRAELREIKQADHDAAKLRRRLQKRGEEIAELQAQLSELRRKKAAGW